MILAATIALALILVGAGLGADRLAAGRVSPDIEAPAHALIAGWAILSLVALACALLGARLTLPVTAVGLFGLAGYLLSPRNTAIVLRLAAAWLIVAPLLLIASTTSPFMADEFTHWLPNTRFLLERDSFSAAADPNIWSGAPGYPPAVPLIGYAIGRSAGSGSELAPKIFCVLLAAGFGLLLAGTLRRRLPSTAAIAAGVAFATVLNPFFDPRIAFTSYADVPSGFVLAFCVQACWQATENPDRHTALRSSATAILLVLLRETNIVLLAGLAAGLLLMGRRGWWPFVGLSVPGGSAFVLWRFFLWRESIPPTALPRPLAEWDWTAPWSVVKAVLTDRLAGNPVVGILGVLLLAGLLATFMSRWRRTPAALRRLLLLSSTTAAVWIAFLAWSYVAVFTPQLATQGNSAWRYLSELGPLFILVFFSLLAAWLPDRSAPPVFANSAAIRTAAAVVAFLVPAALIALTRDHWRVECRYPDVAAVRRIAASLDRAMVGNQTINVVHLSDGLSLARQLDYELHRPLGASVGVKVPGEAHQAGFLLDLAQLDRQGWSDISSQASGSLSRWDGGKWDLVSTFALKDDRDRCDSAQ